MRRPCAKKLKLVYLKSLYLRNFRNYKEASVSFSEKVNVLYGANAAGKTNLLEAIYLVATGRSFRTQNLQELIREGESFFFLDARVLKEGVEQRVQISFDGQSRRLLLDANSYSTLSPLLGNLPIVLCTPYDIELIARAPAERRRFLNVHLAQSNPIYVHHLSRFWRAMKQRNSLLRTKNLDTIECWEIEMAQSAEYIVKARQEMLDELKKELHQEVKDLTGKGETCEIQLQISAHPKNYLQQLQKNRLKERDLGVTLTGPHRDDLSIAIDRKEAKLFSSEGQKKTAITALKLAEWELLFRKMGRPPLMGFDDLESVLDHERQKLLRKRLVRLSQVFITTPHPPQGGEHCIQIDHGSLKENEGLL